MVNDFQECDNDLHRHSCTIIYNSQPIICIFTHLQLMNNALYRFLHQGMRDHLLKYSDLALDELSSENPDFFAFGMELMSDCE